MTTHTLAVLVGPFEMIALFILLSAPIVLAAAHIFFFMTKFNNSRLDLRAEEAKLLSELGKLQEKAKKNKQASYLVSSER
jgi:hypothetical protein